jgi:hypothetical protein
VTSKLKEPHLLLAAANIMRMLRNIAPHISTRSQKSIQRAFNGNVKQLFELGEEHFRFAEKLSNADWRQKISRLYYAAYNVRRAVMLCSEGLFSTDSSDHQKINELPSHFPNASTYGNRLKFLRDDRNISDYGHTASLADLISTPDDAKQLVTDFIIEAKAFLKNRGLHI